MDQAPGGQCAAPSYCSDDPGIGTLGAMRGYDIIQVLLKHLTLLMEKGWLIHVPAKAATELTTDQNRASFRTQ